MWFTLVETEYRVDTCRLNRTRGMFGGNSNWRGPIWFPTNFILIRGLVDLYAYYGDDFTVECPTGSGQQKTLWPGKSGTCSAAWLAFFCKTAKDAALFMAL